MDKAELNRLKGLAEKATPGEWHERCGNSITTADKNIAAHVVRCEDARYIAAANPATVLALIAEIEHLSFLLDFKLSRPPWASPTCSLCGQKLPDAI